jgi:hypothetical protein
MQAEHEGDTTYHGAEKPEEGNRAQSRGEMHPALTAGDTSENDPEKKKDNRNRSHGKEHVPFRKEHGNQQGDTGNRGDKNENIPKISNYC